jgi:membrane associated rhomboid family serine protease
MNKADRTRLIQSMIFPTIFIVIIWLVKALEILFDTRFSHFGIMPMKAEGLIGIVLSPFLHGDIAHLSANSIPFWVLGSLLFYVYRQISWKVITLIWLVTGIWVWFWGREAYHIGASGVIYGLASFLFFSGIFRRDGRLLAITFLVAFLYGSLIWGLFPDLFPEKNISWESHLMGLVAGLVIAVFYRNEGGPARKKYSWEIEEEDDTPEDDPDAYWNKPLQKKPQNKEKVNSSSEGIKINYIYTKKSEGDNIEK